MWSGWLEVASWDRDPTAGQIITFLRKVFVALGIPVVISSDNGPQFRASEYRKFLEEWNVTPRYSSPGYPRSNGHAEAGVKVLKMKKGKAPKVIIEKDNRQH